MINPPFFTIIASRTRFRERLFFLRLEWLVSVRKREKIYFTTPALRLFCLIARQRNWLNETFHYNRNFHEI
jgi:uncharacterized protein YcaQ